MEGATADVPQPIGEMKRFNRVPTLARAPWCCLLTEILAVPRRSATTTTTAAQYYYY